MKRTTLSIPDENLELIHQVMEQRGIATENKAIIYILQDYARIRSQPEEIVSLLTTYYGGDLKKIKSALSEVERISNILLDVTNTMAIEQNLTRLSHVRFEPSPVVEEAEELYQDKLERAQRKKEE